MSFVGLNLGLILRVFGEPRRALGADAGTLLLLSAVAQLLAVSAFVLNTWPRVRER